MNPLAARCYVMSESHLSGYRLILGFETLADVQAAHEFLARRVPPNAVIGRQELLHKPGTSETDQ